MKVEIAKWEGENFGIELSAENKEERKILKRFNDGGIKINAIINFDERLQLTFADLIGINESNEKAKNEKKNIDFDFVIIEISLDPVQKYVEITVVGESADRYTRELTLPTLTMEGYEALGKPRVGDKILMTLEIKEELI